MTTNNQPPLSAEEWLTEYYGHKCNDYEPGCPICEAWLRVEDFKAYAARQAAPLEERIRELESMEVGYLGHCKTLTAERDAAIKELGEVSRKLGKLEAELQWQSAATAPKDGTTVLLNVGYPWAVVGVWNGCNNEWVYAQSNVGMVNGAWTDTYFENEYDPSPTHWRPLPQLPQEGE